MKCLAALVIATTTAFADPPPPAEAPPPPSDPAAAPEDEHDLAPALRTAELRELAEQARVKGYAFLVEAQNPDGTWGTRDPKIPMLRDFGFQMMNEGSQRGVRMACTAICASALLHKVDRTEAEEKALVAAIEPLLGTEKFPYHRGEAFNTWGYGYKLDFLTQLLASPRGAALRERIEAAAAVCVAGLGRYQRADGGWNYYGDQLGGGESMSFNTGNFAQALHRAKAMGIEVPKGMAEDAASLLERMRTVKGGVVYDARFLHDPRSVNELSSGSRTVAVAVALHEIGRFDDDDLRRSLVVFNEGEIYLEDGRKLIQPHTAVHQISGYFFFYGYNYATELAELLGDEVTEERWDRFAWTMIRTQEPNGAWWDTPAAGYGDIWATGFAVRVLDRYLARPAATVAPAKAAPQGDSS